MRQIVNISVFVLGLLLSIGIGISYAQTILYPLPDGNNPSCGGARYYTFGYISQAEYDSYPYCSGLDNLGNCILMRYIQKYDYKAGDNYYNALRVTVSYDCWEAVSYDPHDNGVKDPDEDGIDCGGDTGVPCSSLCKTGDRLISGVCSGDDGVYEPFWASPDAQPAVDDWPLTDEDYPTASNSDPDGVSVDPDFWNQDTETWTNPTETTVNPDGSTTDNSSGGTLSVVGPTQWTQTTYDTETTTNTDGSQQVNTTETTADSDGNTTVTNVTVVYDSNGNVISSNTGTTINGPDAQSEGEKLSGSLTSSVDGEKVGRFGDRLSSFFGAVSGSPVFSAFGSVFLPPSLPSDSVVSLDFGSYGLQSFDFASYSATFTALGLIFAAMAFIYSCRLVVINRG
ncbi:hypothetical protein [uncultured Desulfuromonas sp.]|uniref:hypothetical protein n=1 Tax=uncultured Desulfuromonas sp. TaxID=181013 RepID=UPI002AAC2606|nr:hypothetical protein [uncultured Desulfuromonas sp.]